MPGILDMILGRGVKAYAAEATDEELSSLGKKLFTETTPPIAPSKAIVIDAAIVADKKEEKPVEDSNTVGARTALDACMKAMKDGDKGAMKKHKQALDAYFTSDAEEEEKPAEDSKVEELKEEKHAEDKKEEEEEKEEEKHTEDAEEMTEDAARAEKEINDPGKSVLKAANDSVRQFLKISKPLMAVIANKPTKQRTSAEKVMLDSYNGAVRSMNEFGSGKAYKLFAIQRTPENVPAIINDATAQPVEDLSRFYEGVPFAIGKKRAQEYLDKKGSK